MGIRVEEFAPLLEGETVLLDDGNEGSLWSEPITVTDPGVEILAWYKTGEQGGRPAITRRPVGSGSATYVSTRLGTGLEPVLRTLLDDAHVPSDLPASVRGKVELAVRGTGEHEFWFLINRTAEQVDVDGVAGDVLVGRRTGGAPDGTVVLAPRGVAVLRRPKS
ncbi:beta-galactosidase trimerization domain-containing protein [Oerskovia sp. M15]